METIDELIDEKYNEVVSCMDDPEGYEALDELIELITEKHADED